MDLLLQRPNDEMIIAIRHFVTADSVILSDRNIVGLTSVKLPQSLKEWGHVVAIALIDPQA